ncbi:calcium-binding protein [Geitlerinema sp. P-1104]|uniref:calcium-binding protein n=1 Tax=Geitlerinema sp. P-1104 TaxID=2546230 RepID=UPI001476FA2A|nr:calcium-binding protein [Geitlerinema sp. P-1104]NMG58035.1 calcium-binding protein [Geitlerinema sp. P-1104]
MKNRVLLDDFFTTEGSGAFDYTIRNEDGGTAIATATILDTIPQVFDARGGDNTLQLKTEGVVDLSEADDQTPEDTLTVLNFNHVIGSSGDDSLRGNDNDNLLIGSEGDDTVIGVNGDNTLIGVDVTNVLIGGDGDDLIIAGPQDQISGGEGVDTLLIDGDDDVVVAMPNDIEVLITGEGNDSLIGTPGSDSIISAGGNNTLDGGGGGDFFMGGPGGDVIIAANGPDTFAIQDPTDGPDTLLNQNLLSILQFTDDDVILVSADGFGGDLTPGVLPSEQFTLGNSASDPNHRFILHKPLLGNDVLYYDPDGDGPEPQVPILVFRDFTLLDLSETSIVIF